MALDLTRSLAQILISKLGGNVDHNTNSVILELIDNSIDAHAKSININAFEKNTENGKKFYLEIYDNGVGIENIINILNASYGKKNKIGCKNQGFCDSLIYLSKLKGSHEIYSCFNGKFSRLSIDFDELNDEYIKQKGLENNEHIDYAKCQSILNDNITQFNNKHTKEHLKNGKLDIYRKIENNGTFISIELFKDFEFKEIDIEYFQYNYACDNIKLNFCGKKCNINDIVNICLTNNYKPAIFKFFRSTHINKNNLLKFDNNFNDEKYHCKQTTQLTKCDENKYEEALNSYEEKEILDAELSLTLISVEEAENQMTIFNESSIENLRQLWIEFKGKLLGPFKFPKKITGLSARNMLNVRILLKIYNDTILNEIVMSNKSKTNIDNISNSMIKFLEYCKPYLKQDYSSNLGKQFKKLKEDKKEVPGVKNMVEFLKQTVDEQNIENQKVVNNSEKKNDRKENDREDHEELEKKCEERKNQLKKELEESKQKEKKEQEEIKKKANYKPWSKQVYFGILGCKKEEGVSAKDNYIRCHYGITNDDPNHRDSGNGLGAKNGWRRLITIYLNKEGYANNEGKYEVEWQLKKTVESFKKNIIWETNEYFSCKREIFKAVYNKIRITMINYEGDYF